MAYQSLDPIDLSAAAVGDSYTALPSGQYEGVSQVLLTNNSGFAFAISASSMGELPPLSAYSSAAYNAPPNGGALTATISGGQPGNQPPVQLGIMLAFGTSNFGGVSQAVGSVNIGSEVNITGNVTVDSITGTVDANITNASIPVTGDVQANVTNATLTVDGTVSLTAGQVVEVTNQAGGSLTVAGTVDATVQNATIESGTVDISTMPIGSLLTTLAPGANSYTIDAATIAKSNTLVLTGTPTDLSHLTSVTTSTAPFYALPFGGIILPGSNVPCVVMVALPTDVGVTIAFGNTPATAPVEDILVYGSTGVSMVAAAVTNLPLSAINPSGTPAVNVRPHVPVQTVSVGNPAAGADWSFALPWPARVKAVWAQLDSAAGGSNPTLYVAGVPLYWETGTLSAGTYYLRAWPGPPALAVVSQFSNILLAFPDMGVLPAGAVINANGQAAGDQWSNINVVLEPA